MPCRHSAVFKTELEYCYAHLLHSIVFTQVVCDIRFFFRLTEAGWPWDRVLVRLFFVCFNIGLNNDNNEREECWRRFFRRSVDWRIKLATYAVNRIVWLYAVESCVLQHIYRFLCMRLISLLSKQRTVSGAKNGEREAGERSGAVNGNRKNERSGARSGRSRRTERAESASLSRSVIHCGLCIHQFTSLLI